MTVFPKINFLEQRTEYCFEVYDKTMEDIFCKTYKIKGPVHKYINTTKINWHYIKNKNLS